MLPDPSFIARALELKDWPESPFIAAGGLLEFPDEAIAALGTNPNIYATLLTYMIRRFGLPNKPSDPHKSIADWFITTPHPEVSLMVSPKVSGARYSFGYMVSNQLAHRLIASEVTLQDTGRRIRPISEYNHALGVAVKDLLRPVSVRDCYINAKGEVDEDDGLFGEYDETTDEDLSSFVVNSSDTAGRFWPTEMLATEEWTDLYRSIHEAGHGDIRLGVAEIIRQLKKVQPE